MPDIEQLKKQLETADLWDRPILMEDLAREYSVAGQHDLAIATMEQAIGEGWAGQPDGRAMVAEFLLRAGRMEEAHALYAAIKADTPDDVWLYNAAAWEYQQVGDHERALQWLTEGLKLAMASGDPDRIVGQLAEMRAESLQALGLPDDALQLRAEEFAHPETRSGAAGTLVAIGWFPESEFAEVLSRWPHLRDSWEEETYQGYCQLLEARLSRFRSIGARVCLAPIRLATYLPWCAQREVDPGSEKTRSLYAAGVPLRNEALPWPPGRNDPCWCGSGRKYKKCCGK